MRSFRWFVSAVRRTAIAAIEKESRSVSVDSRGILEALRKVYGVDALVTELRQGKRWTSRSRKRRRP